MTTIRDTKVEFIRPAFLALKEAIYIRESGYMCDVGAGDFRWGTVAREIWPDAYIDGCETDLRLARPAKADSWITKPFQHYNPDYQYDLIFGNPQVMILKQ